MAAQQQLAVAFAQAVQELVTVEKKNIVVLTEIARDALAREPGAAPSLAAVITNRIIQAPAPQKLPVLYLLDSISKLVGEPYKTLFSPALPEAFMSAWQQGGPGLHRPLDKLLATWTPVFPHPVLAEIQSRVAALRAAQAPLQVQPPAVANGYGGGVYGYAPVVAVPALGQQPGYSMQQQAAVPYGQQQAGYGGFQAPAYQQQQPQMQQPQSYYQQQQQYPQQYQQQTQQGQQVSVPDLLSSLMNAGLLQPAGAPLAQGGGSGVLATPPHTGGATATPPYVGAAAAAAAPEREQPASSSFTPDRIKEHNPSAVARLLRQTEATKSRFLDRKFLRRQQKQAGAAARGSRHWYLDLDTWMASTVGGAGGASAAGSAAGAGGAASGRQGGQAANQAAAAAALAAQKHSVPVDDSQTHCALSGEQFEQFWDEEHQEWRYRDAKALDAEEAASYGLEEGAIVLVSALGKPAASVLQAADQAGGSGAGGGGGVLSQLAVQQEIAADLAAAAAALAGGGEEEGAEEDAKDEKASLKHLLSEEPAADAAAAAEGEEPPQQPPEKRLRAA